MKVCREHAKLLCWFDDVFSCLCQVDPTRERIREAGNFFSASMKTSRKIGLSVTQKSHISEHHAMESMQDLNGLGVNTEDFIGLSDQYCALQYRCTKGLRYYKQKHKSQHKADH